MSFLFLCLMEIYRAFLSYDTALSIAERDQKEQQQIVQNEMR